MSFKDFEMCHRTVSEKLQIIKRPESASQVSGQRVYRDKKYFISLTLSFFLTLQVTAQTIVWEKEINVGGRYESLSKVVMTDVGIFLASGTSDKWKFIQGNSTWNGLVLSTFTEEGDSLWSTFTGIYGGIIDMAVPGNGKIYCLMVYMDTLLLKQKIGIMVLSSFGDYLYTLPITIHGGTNYWGGRQIYGMKYNKGYLWLYGYQSPSIYFPNTQFSSDCLIKKIDLAGNEVFSSPLNHSLRNCSAASLEFLPSGNLLISEGYITYINQQYEHEISCYEVDTNGIEVRYFSLPSIRSKFIVSGLAPMITKDQGLLAHGNMYLSDSTFHYLVKFDSLGNKSWQLRRNGYLSKPWRFSDGTYISYHMSRTPMFRKFTRFGPDAAVLSEINLDNPPSPLGKSSLSDIYFDGLGSGVGVGAISHPGPYTIQHFYLAKYNDLGIPFNPAITQTPVQQKLIPNPEPFPNPGSNYLSFPNLSDSYFLKLMDSRGITVLSGNFISGLPILLSSLTPGLYHYSLEINGKVFQGKWIKD